MTDKPKLIRDPADWARESGWVSRVRAERAAERLLNLARIIDESLGDDDGGQMWRSELESVAKYLAPKRDQR